MVRLPIRPIRASILASRAAIALTLIGVSFAVAPSVQAAQPEPPARPEGPCDIYAAGGTPCVAAHSSTRTLYASYNGPLYQVRRTSDNAVKDIGVVAPVALPFPDAGGYADAAAQDSFCANTVCLITVIYDQSGKGNHLYQAPPGTFRGPDVGGFNTLSIADMAPITIGGHKAYGVYIMPGMGYRNNNASYLAKDDEPEGIYTVFDGTHYDSGCCYNYGNTSTNSRAVGRGTMETVYFGTATAWGRGTGPGPWIMSDMEAGLFSGYNAKQNDGTPTIDSWRFVTGVVNGGGGNQWDLRGGNAQEGPLTTYYSGIRPGSLTDSNYFPMHRRGAIQLGNGGDNGNGSAGTFYEGVMTTGYPTDATVNAVQANIVAARYDVQRLGLSPATTFTPGSTQQVTETFTNTTGSTAVGVKLGLSAPTGWTAVVKGTDDTSVTFEDPVAPGASVSATFTVTSAAATGAGFLTGTAEWTNPTRDGRQSTVTTQRVRNAVPIRINEVRFRTSTNATDQFIELYNASADEVDLSNWTLTNTPSGSAPVTLATIPAGTKLASGAYYLLGLSNSGLAASAGAGATTINARSTAGFAAGQQIDIGTGSSRETRTIIDVGSAATAATTLFVPVTHGSITIPAASTNIPVTNATGFTVGQQIGIDSGASYEQATVIAVGKAATQTTLSAPASAGATNIKVAANANMTVGDTLTVDAGEYKEVVTVAAIGTTGASGTGVDLAAPLKFDHRSAVDVAGPGTGISFSPATRLPHASGVSVQALGSGITLDNPLVHSHATGAAVVNPLVTTAGYQGQPVPDQWFGGALSVSAGSIALRDATGGVVVDAIVYGSQQSSSSGNGTITSPELAVMEADQGGGGCIAVVAGAAGNPGRSNARWPDGTDTDSLCHDFITTTVPTPGTANAR